MALKAGGVTDSAYANSMAQRIEQEFDSAWEFVFGHSLPTAHSRQRRVFFVAIARGVLGYLEAHQNEAINSIKLVDWSDSENVDELDLNIEM